jgi:hypothetical protein
MPDFGVRKIGCDLIFAFAPTAGADAGYRWQVAYVRDLTDDMDRVADEIKRRMSDLLCFGVTIVDYVADRNAIELTHTLLDFQQYDL